MGIHMEITQVNLGTGIPRGEPELYSAMETPGEYYMDTLHTIAIKTRETEFGSIVEPIPITLKTYKPSHVHGHPMNGYAFPPQQMLSSLVAAPRVPEVEIPSTSTYNQSSIKENFKETKEDLNKNIARPPPKKKWIKEYLEEEPKSPVSVRVVTGLSVVPRVNGVVRPQSPAAPPCLPAPVPPVVVEPAPTPAPAPLLDFVQEHSRPRTTSNSHGPPQIPSPPSVSSNGSGSSSSNSSVPRAGTREVHNKLEKNRRAHLKECFELLKRQLPATPDDKKTSNLSILGSAIRYIQVLRRKERECEHEMERLAREKIAAQQRLAALKREVSVRATVRPRRIIDSTAEDKGDSVNGQVIGIPISITSSPPHSVVTRMEASPPRTLNLSTKLRTLPIQITPTTSQVVRTSYGTRHNTLTLTTLAPADATQNGQTVENGVTNTLGTTLVHPAQIHLPLSQVVGSGGLVVGPALQLLSTSGLRVLQAPTIHTNGMTTNDNSRIPKENGIVSPTPVSTAGSVVVSGLTPIVVSQPHLLQTHTLTHKMVETQMVKGSVAPLTVSAQYLSATTIVKPVVVVSSAPPAPPAHPAPSAPRT
ncbi:max-binding protein MNT-like isoform X2 [Plodia interpunctella]|uniref:max-binding protein MNT-like isoform X2 n=1 Tax=Plodia interpunctella TaxID=58824 RepID=UPI002368971E|nr:max-binding protein MNT-like isoform X2 [Plodia interpunctella]